MTSNRNYICSERAHFMCPNMHFGISAHIAGDFDEKQVRQSVDAIQKAHPFLQSLIAQDDTGRLYYQLQDCLKISMEEKTDYHFWQRDYDELSARGFDVLRECMLKIFVYPMEHGFRMLFIAHHLLCDGRGLLQLAEEFAQHYVKGIPPQFAEERLIQSIHDLPPNSRLPFISRQIVSGVNKRWKNEQHKVSYEEYWDFERNYIAKNRIKKAVTTVDGLELKKLQALCRKHGISINDYLIAQMMKTDYTSKVVIAADIRSKLLCYRQGAMGNYSTAFSVVVKRRNNDILSLAKCAAAKVSDIMNHPEKEMLVLACYLQMQPELIDAVAIATLGQFPSKAGAFVGKSMFGYGSRNGYSITNLGRMQSDVIKEAVFIPPASPANKKTVGVLTVNGCMKICSAVAAEDISQKSRVARP